MYAWIMFNVPLGKRLWLAAVLIAVVILLVQPPWAVYFMHPLQYGQELALFLGKVMAVEALVTLVLSMAASGLQEIVRRRGERNLHEFFVLARYRVLIWEQVYGFLSAGVFVGVVYRVPSFNLPWWVGVFGLALYLMLECLVMVESTSIRVFEYLDLSCSSESDMIFVVYEHGKKQSMCRLYGVWRRALAYLNENGWEMVRVDEKEEGEGEEKVVHQSALYRRAYNRGFIFTEEYWKPGDIQVDMPGR
jgi:hypothetical protein